MKLTFKLSIVALALSVAACSDNDDSTPVVEETIVEENQVSEYGPFATGTTSSPVTVYFDLDTGTKLDITDEDAATNTSWDIAFKRTNVYLNSHADNSVQMYFVGNNAEFYSEDGSADIDMFTTATAETELEDYEAVTYSDIPSDDTVWQQDVTEQILAGFYNYDSSTHQVSAAADKYYVVQSDSEFTKFRVSELVQEGFSMSSITFAVQHQAEGEQAFAQEQSFTLDLAMLCASSDFVYVDLQSQLEVTAEDSYDVMLTCVTGGADFDLTLAETATAIQDFANVHTGISAAAAPHYGFQSNEYTVKAFSSAPWYSYNLQGGHLLWSQYGVYIIKTTDGYHKLQITSYYNEDGESGNYSFRADALTDDQ